MKLLVFAHTPPPSHGQSYMVLQMLRAFGGDRRKARGSSASAAPYGIECYHVNARISKDLEDIGATRAGKIPLLLLYCIEAIWCRFRYRVNTLYYVPAPGKMAALVRDWTVMLLCRPFYRHIILHWHAAGLGKWLEVASSGVIRRWTYRMLGRPSLSIVISEYNKADACKLLSRRVERVNYGIQDPCPDFQAGLGPERMRRSERFQQALGGEGLGPDNAEQRPADVLPVFRILFLANCLRTKGLFVALDAFLLLRQRLRQRGVPLKLQMDVAGAFAGEADESAFRRQVEAAQAVEEVRCLGFVSGADKDRVLREADLMCFPTFYPGENQPVTLIEALAYGLPAVTTSWRSIPDIFPDGYRGIVPPQDVEATAAAMEALLTFKDHATLRQRFCQQFTIEAHLDSLARALKSVT